MLHWFLDVLGSYTNTTSPVTEYANFDWITVCYDVHAEQVNNHSSRSSKIGSISNGNYSKCKKLITGALLGNISEIGVTIVGKDGERAGIGKKEIDGSKGLRIINFVRDKSDRATIDNILNLRQKGRELI